jgi:glycosyltransferase involved in cell wall biosynthesis
MDPLTSSQASDRPSSKRHGTDKLSVSLKRKKIKIYMMELWSFIPYYIASICTNLRDESVDVVLGTVRYHLDRDYFRKAGLTPDSALLDLGGAIRFPRLRRLIKTIEYIANLFGLALRLAGSRPDVLHVQYLPFLEHGFPFEIWFMRWVRLLGIRLVYTVHNVTPQDAPDHYKRLYLSTYQTADALICHGNEARSRLIQDFSIPDERIWVVPHGPLFAEKPDLSAEEARAKLGLCVEEPLVLCLGVISQYKGIFFLLNAWKRLVEEGARGRLLIAGTGDARLLSEIRESVAAVRIGSSVDLWLRFIPVEELPLLYQAADILVYPYKACTTSGALLTGMNYGKAIVATTLPFFQEHLNHGKDAALIQYGDVNGLAETLAELIQHPLKRERLGRSITEARATCASWRSIASATLECYETVCRITPREKSQREPYHHSTQECSDVSKR